MKKILTYEQACAYVIRTKVLARQDMFLAGHSDCRVYMHHEAGLLAAIYSQDGPLVEKLLEAGVEKELGR